jgi:hypothetical protein
MVLAEDPATGIVEPHRVLQLFRNTKDHLQIVEIRDGAGNQQRIDTTDEHPFWVVSRGEWVATQELKSGDLVLQSDGQNAEVISTIREDHPSGIATYNFEVEGVHSYFVAAHGSTGPPVLVHNDCHHPIPKYAGGNATGQKMSNLTPAQHTEYHQLLRAELKARHLPPEGGKTGSYAAWKKYMQSNPGGQGKAFDAALEAARSFDVKNGTNLVQDVWYNITNNFFTPFP